MAEMLVIVADGGIARFYRVEPPDGLSAKARLIETALIRHPDLEAHSSTGRPPTETNTDRSAGPVHPITAQRERHDLEHERRFVRDIARSAGVITKSWSQGAVVLVAGPRMLGLLREPLRTALQGWIVLKELAKDYADLPPSDLLDRLSMSGIVGRIRASEAE